MNKRSIVGIVIALCFGAFLTGALTSVFTLAQNENAITPASVSLPAFNFLRNLRVGDNIQDVRMLQILLNRDPDTQIALEGIGSVGNEGTYFGGLTLAAVMRFQNKNSIDATGFVGPLTRVKLNQIISSAIATSSASSTSVGAIFSGAQPLAKEPLPRLYTARPQQIKKTDTFTLIGAGFLPDNTLHIGSYIFNHVLPQDDNNISFTIPATSTITNGTYPIWLENNYGTSQVLGKNVSLIITDNPVPAPTISSVAPSDVAGLESVTVTGTGFSSSGNSIFSGFGTIKNVSSNGTQITFSPRSFVSADLLKSLPVGTVLKIDFYVMTANDVSNIFGSVNLKI